MAKLDDAFSSEDRRKSVVRRLKPGTVLYLDVSFPEKIKPKYLVVAQVDRDCCTFIVNSRVREFIKKRPLLAACQVRIDHARHDFLRHDSFIACHEILRLRTASVVDSLVANMDRIKGTLHKDVLTEVIAAVKRAPTLSPTEQTTIAQSLSGSIDD